MTKRLRLIFIPEDLLEDLMDVASREGIPLNNLVEKDLRNILKAHKLGVSLEDMAKQIEITYTQKSSGITLIPLKILHYMEGKAEKETLKKKWRRAGAWYGKYIKTRYNSPAKFLGELLKATRWDLDEINMKETDGSINFRLVSATLTAEQTEFLINFIEGAMHALGYRKTKDDSTKGIILLEWKG